MRKIQNKKGAIELSIGTVVIIVLAMAMLILGLVLVRNIFAGATDSIDEINDGVKSQVIKLFTDEGEKAVLRLSDNTAKIKQGDEFGFAFGVRNNQEGVITSSTFKYETKAVSVGTCRTLDQANSWILFGDGRIAVQPGQVESKVIKFKLPEEAPLCTAEYQIIIWSDDITGQSRNSPYADLQFFIEVEAGGIF